MGVPIDQGLDMIRSDICAVLGSKHVLKQYLERIGKLFGVKLKHAEVLVFLPINLEVSLGRKTTCHLTAPWIHPLIYSSRPRQSASSKSR